jgi:hypothetical protein
MSSGLSTSLTGRQTSAFGTNKAVAISARGSRRRRSAIATPSAFTSAEVGRPNRFDHCSTGTGSSVLDIDNARNDLPPNSIPANSEARVDAGTPSPALLSAARTRMRRSLA